MSLSGRRATSNWTAHRQPATRKTSCPSRRGFSFSLRVSLVCGVLLTLQQTKGNSLRQQRAAAPRRARAGRVRKHRGRRCSNGAGSKSQKFPFVRESGAKRCRFFVPARTGRVWVDRRIAVWCHDACNRRTAAVAWQKMQHLVRAERTADRMKFNARITASMDRERFGPPAPIRRAVPPMMKSPIAFSSPRSCAYGVYNSAV